MIQYIVLGILLVLVVVLSYFLGRAKASTSFFEKKLKEERAENEIIAKNRSDIASMSDDDLNDELCEGLHKR